MLGARQLAELPQVHCGLGRDASSRLIALGTSGARRMQEEERILPQVFECDSDDVASARKPRMSMSDAPLGLETTLPQPCVGESEAQAAMVVLPIVDPDREAALEDGEVLRRAIRNAGEKLRQVKRRVGVVTDSEKEDLPVQFVHAADRAFGNVRRKR